MASVGRLICWGAGRSRRTVRVGSYQSSLLGFPNQNSNIVCARNLLNAALAAAARSGCAVPNLSGQRADVAKPIVIAGPAARAASG